MYVTRLDTTLYACGTGHLKVVIRYNLHSWIQNILITFIRYKYPNHLHWRCKHPKLIGFKFWWSIGLKYNLIDLRLRFSTLGNKIEGFYYHWLCFYSLWVAKVFKIGLNDEPLWYCLNHIIYEFAINAIWAIFIHYTLCLMLSKYYLLLALRFVTETKLL